MAGSAYRDDYDSAAVKWCTEKLITDNGHLSITIQKDLAGPAMTYHIWVNQLKLLSSGSVPPPMSVNLGNISIHLTKSLYRVAPFFIIRLPFQFEDTNSP